MTSSTKLSGLLLSFGVGVYALDRLVMPTIGMLSTQIISAILLLGLLVAYLMIARAEQDEREQLLRLQADSAALYTVLAGLLAATIFYPKSDVAMVFWLVLGLAAVGRVITFMYKRYQ